MKFTSQKILTDRVTPGRYAVHDDSEVGVVRVHHPVVCALARTLPVPDHRKLGGGDLLDGALLRFIPIGPERT